MGITAETVRKIAAVANDESTDEATRAVALARLHEAYAREPGLFPSALPGARPAASRAAPKGSDRERETFLEPAYWPAVEPQP